MKYTYIFIILKNIFTLRTELNCIYNFIFKYILKEFVSKITAAF